MIASEILPEPDPSSGVVGHVTLQPNNSMSWRALKWFLLFMMTVSFSIAITLTVLGYWVVLIFTEAPTSSQFEKRRDEPGGY